MVREGIHFIQHEFNFHAIGMFQQPGQEFEIHHSALQMRTLPDSCFFWTAFQPWRSMKERSAETPASSMMTDSPGLRSSQRLVRRLV